jgi:hypothetical protein
MTRRVVIDVTIWQTFVVAVGAANLLENTSSPTNHSIASDQAST